MPFPEDTPSSLARILDVMERTRGDSDRFADLLWRERIPHLSFSQVTTVEFCPYRYYLQYVAVGEALPAPDYFTKGKLLHQMIASTYQGMAQYQPPDLNAQRAMVDREFEGLNRRHLHNALTVCHDHLWRECEVLAVEEPFAMLLDEDLPPCVGVIDLILRQDGHFVIIDHKTGRDFYPQDELQMAIYVEYIRRKYGDKPCVFYYDQYRWVNNLDRIRKPAFQRHQVTIPDASWQGALQRIRSAHHSIRFILEEKRAEKNGECFRCPCRSICYPRR